MRAEGYAHHVGGRDSVPLPMSHQHIAPRLPDVACACGHRGRPGAFHLCIDLGTPEPVIAPRPKKKAAQPKSRAKRSAGARPPRKPRDCMDCGAPISKMATRCATCAGLLRRGAPRASWSGPIVSRIEEVERRYQEGESVQSLATDLGVGASGIRVALRRAGVTLRSQGDSQRGRRGQRALTDEQAIEAARMYTEDGMTMDAIGEHFSLGQHGVRNTLRRLGVEPRRRGGPGNRAAA